MKIYNKIILIVFLALFACNNSYNTEYIESIKKWDKERLSSLKSENGWLNLVGLFWLEKGDNSFGSDSINKIVFPSGTPANIGVITFSDNLLEVKINKEVDVYCNKEKVTKKILLSDADGEPTVLKMESYVWFIIYRNGKYAIRLRNLKNKLIDEVNEISRFDIDKKWRIKAKYKEYCKAENMSVPNIIGYHSLMKCFGVLSFEINNKEYSLNPIINDDGSFFVIFADGTSAIETYGAGRFLDVEKPNKENVTYLDFNKAYNPPCVFSNFATCPLPPIENIILVEIRAGEKIGKHFSKK
ncbi:MAG: DUF1684 domain-containing protein [Bacteroidota bacterium]|nr:DUF1684 domain-containing protein [Bacteroidota bacterium]